jgi:hypothetical protein
MNPNDPLQNTIDFLHRVGLHDLADAVVRARAVTSAQQGKAQERAAAHRYVEAVARRASGCGAPPEPTACPVVKQDLTSQPARPEAVRLRDELRERTAFEAWAVAQCFRASNIETTRDSVVPEWYVSDVAALSWRAWQAALASVQPSPAGQEDAHVQVLRSLREILNESGRSGPARNAALAARQPVGHEPVELACVAETLSKGGGLWMTCSGCHESNEGAPSGPYSKIMRCYLGNGCDECGGIGAIWDTTDYQNMSDEMSQPLAATPAQAVDLDAARSEGHYSAVRYVLGYLNGRGDCGSTQYEEILNGCGRHGTIKSAVQDDELEFTGLGDYVEKYGTAEDRALIDSGKAVQS